MQVGKWSRYKKSILSVCLGLIAMVISVCSFSMTSKANVVDEYYLDYAEPTCSDSQGYISLALLRSDGEIFINTFFWNSNALDGNVRMPCSVYCEIANNTIRFRPYTNLDFADVALISLTRINEKGSFYPYEPSSSVAPSWNFGAAGYTLLGFKYGGNALCEWTIPNSYYFALYFSGDGSAQQLMYIYSVVQNSAFISQQQLSTLTNILNENRSTNVKLDSVTSYLMKIRGDLTDISEQLDEILGEEKKQTSWLEKIWQALTGSDSQKEEIEEEKSKAEEQAGQLGQLNEQNKTDKVDPGQAQESVNGAIDRNQIQNYSIVLSVFTNESHIGQMILIVIALTLVSYVLFGKK